MNDIQIEVAARLWNQGFDTFIIGEQILGRLYPAQGTWPHRWHSGENIAPPEAIIARNLAKIRRRAKLLRIQRMRKLSRA